MMIPIVMGFVISLTNYDGFAKMDFVGFKNYIAMFKDDYFIVSVKNNFLYTLVTVPVTLILSTLLAVALNTGIKGSGLFKTMYFFPYITSMVAVGIIWTLLFNPNVGPINNVLRAIGIANPPKWLLSTKSALWGVMKLLLVGCIQHVMKLAVRLFLRLPTGNQSRHQIRISQKSPSDHYAVKLRKFLLQK